MCLNQREDVRDEFVDQMRRSSSCCSITKLMSARSQRTKPVTLPRRRLMLSASNASDSQKPRAASSRRRRIRSRAPFLQTSKRAFFDSIINFFCGILYCFRMCLQARAFLQDFSTLSNSFSGARFLNIFYFCKRNHFCKQTNEVFFKITH